MSKMKVSPMKKWRLVSLLVTFSSMSCAAGKELSISDFATQVRETGTTRITGWARLRGEIMVFATRQAMQRKERFPSCVSGVFSDQATRQLSNFDGKKVTVTGELVRFDTLSDEDAPLLKRKVLEGSVIPNFCFGDNVLLIRTIETVS